MILTADNQVLSFSPQNYTDIGHRYVEGDKPPVLWWWDGEFHAEESPGSLPWPEWSGHAQSESWEKSTLGIEWNGRYDPNTQTVSIAAQNPKSKWFPKALERELESRFPDATPWYTRTGKPSIRGFPEMILARKAFKPWGYQSIGHDQVRSEDDAPTLWWWEKGSLKTKKSVISENGWPMAQHMNLGVDTDRTWSGRYDPTTNALSIYAPKGLFKRFPYDLELALQRKFPGHDPWNFSSGDPENDYP